MSAQEWDCWLAYYQQFPFDDFHRFHRPAAMVGASMAGDYKDKIAFLQPDPIPPNSKYNAADLDVLNQATKRKKK